MKKIIIASVLVGIAYGVILFLAAAACLSSEPVVSSFVYGVALAVLVCLLDIPTVYAQKSSAWIRILLIPLLAVGCAMVVMLPLARAWPQVTFGTGEFSFGWALFGCVAGVVAIEIPVGFIRRRRAATKKVTP